jgi:hypothetical protein
MTLTVFDKEGRWLRNLGGQRGRKDSGDKWPELSREMKVEE